MLSLLKARKIVDQAIWRARELGITLAWRCVTTPAALSH